MSTDKKYVKLAGRIVMIGFGSIGQGVLPLLLRNIDLTPAQITIICPETRDRDQAEAAGVAFIQETLTRDNYKTVLAPLLGQGDVLLNLSVDVSSIDLIEFIHPLGALYLDTCIEPWPGGYTDPSLSPSLRSNYAMREKALGLRRKLGPGPTAVITHGANPGLVSHFVKQALLNIARDTGVETDVPTTRSAWAALGQKLGVKTIHIAERDTQIAAHHPRRRREFVNTWSIDGFVSEGCQPAELGWGSHEKHLPADGNHHDFGDGAAIWLSRPGASTRVRTWAPLEGPFHGFLITHGEAISIADYFTVRDGETVAYRPTCHYAYHPCDDAVSSLHEFNGKNYELQTTKRLIVDEVTEGVDELGVLLMGHAKGAYWFGSHLSIEEARALAPHNNATSLQVTSPVLAGVIWALENPDRGVTEPDEMDYARILDICAPYLGPVVGAYTDWTPLEGRETLFPEDLDRDDPWQFKNFRVV